MTWRVYAGDPCPEDRVWVFVDEITQGYSEARAILAGQLEPYRTDDCPECRKVGTGELERLLALPEGTCFEAEVDGYLFTLTEAAA